MSTPADHGYVVCSRCLTWRPEDATVRLDVEGDVCIDRQWCSEQAGVGKGELDADTGRPAPRLPFSPDSEGTP